MIPRPILTVLVFALPVLVVALAVLLAAAGLTQGLGDEPASRVLFWVAMAALILLAIDAILLLGSLGMNAIGKDDADEADHEPGE